MNLKLLSKIIEAFPPGSIVYHIADETRGVVTEYSIDCQGCVMINVSFGANIDWQKYLPQELTVDLPLSS